MVATRSRDVALEARAHDPVTTSTATTTTTTTTSAPPPPPTDDTPSTPPRGCCSRVLHAWETAQVELHGHYTPANLRRFGAFARRTSWARALGTCLLTPAPCIAVAVLVDLLPLEPIARGARGSPMVWTRMLLVNCLTSTAMLEQFRQHIPRLGLRRRTMLGISLLAAVVIALLVIALSLVIGYPLPFVLTISALPWLGLVLSLLYATHRSRLRSHAEIRRDLGRYLVVVGAQVAMTIVYPVYTHAYVTMGPREQTAFVLLLPVIKLVGKNWISRALPDADDGKPEAVILNIEIFHSLFVSLCIQGTASAWTIAALMLVDLVQVWLSFRDVNALLAHLEAVVVDLDGARGRTDSTGSRSRRDLQHLIELACQIVEAEPGHRMNMGFARRLRHEPSSKRWVRPVFKHESISPSISSLPPPHSILPTPPHLANQRTSSTSSPISEEAIAAIVPPSTASTTAPSLPSDAAALTYEQRGLVVRTALKLLYIVEFVVLIEFTEIMMPLLYVVYLSVIRHLGNVEHYTFFRGQTPEQISQAIGNVATYAVVEVASLGLMAGFFWRRLRLSVVHQLAFVLETRAASVQAKIFLWVLNILQRTVVQYGTDYTLTFAWLRSKG